MSLRTRRQPAFCPAAAPAPTSIALAVLASLGALGASQALAQAAAAPAKAPEQVVVTGMRAAIESALNAKRQDLGIVDVVKAEDIAKFPDTNLAESLQRVPGVVIDRDAGEGRTITVRGLGPDFTRVRINGMEAMAATGGTDASGGANRGRGFDFNVFAADLFNSLTVRKSASADVDEGSLGATVDLQTARPFDFKTGTTASLAASARYNDLSGETTPRLAGLWAHTFEGRRAGVLLSAAYSKRKVLEEGFSTVRWANGVSGQGLFATAGSDATALAASNNAANFHPRIPRYGRLTHDQDRLGITGSLQFKPSDSTLVTADLMYSKLEATRQEDFLEAISFSRTTTAGLGQTSVLAAQYDAKGNLLYGKYNGVDIRSESRYDKLFTEFVQPTLKIEHDLSDTLKLSTRLGRSQSRFRNPIQTTVTLDANNVNGYEIDFRGNSRLPTITYPISVTTVGAGGLDFVGAAAGSTVPATLLGSEIRVRPLGTTNINEAGQVDLAWEALPDRLTLKAGVDVKRYMFDSFEFRRGTTGTVEASMFALPAGVTSSSLTTLLTGFGKGLSMPAGTPTTWIIPNLSAIAAAYDIYCNCIKSGAANGPGDFTLHSTDNASARANNQTVVEHTRSGYLMGEFREKLAGIPLRGNAGVRYVQTREATTGYLSNGNQKLMLTNSYDDVLPAINVAADLSRELILRASAAKVMARPQLNWLNPNGTVSVTGSSAGTVTMGNPYLKPYRAKTFDTSAEWYFQRSGFIGLGLFYKDIDTYIQRAVTTMPYSQTGLPTALLNGTSYTADSSFTVTQPINTEGGKLTGIELNWQQPFTFLPGPLRNLGMLVNYTQVNSKIAYRASAAANATTIRDDLLNMSPRTYNATLYYEDDKFSARVSGSYRSGFLTLVPGQNNNDVEGTNSVLSVDMSMSYKWNNQLTLTFEGTNLTNAKKDQFVGRDRNSPVVYNVTGREFMAGLRYKF